MRLPDLAALLEHLQQMPGDGLAFAVRVGRQIQRLGLLQRPGDGLDMLRILFQRLIAHGEAMLGVDRTLLGTRSRHVPVRGEHLEVLAQVLLDGARLGGRSTMTRFSAMRWCSPVRRKNRGPGRGLMMVT